MEDFAEFDLHDHEPEVISNEDKQIDEWQTQCGIMMFIFLMSFAHTFSDVWIQFILNLCIPVDKETCKIIQSINELKEALKNISQVDEFARYSKIERKINKLRQDLESKNSGTATIRLQSKAAFVTAWRTLGVKVHHFNTSFP